VYFGDLDFTQNYYSSKNILIEFLVKITTGDEFLKKILNKSIFIPEIRAGIEKHPKRKIRIKQHTRKIAAGVGDGLGLVACAWDCI